MVSVHGTRAASVDPEVHVFLLWSNALGSSDRILADIRSRFRVLDVFSVEWSREHFAHNLTRFYGQTLPSGSEKEVHCGVGPFLVVVVEDPQPAYARRRTTRGQVTLNVRMFDAKKRYRRWTGGGHRVHATVNPREADKDLFLLLGLRTASYASREDWAGNVVTLRRDLTGADGWESRAELLTAVETVTGYVALDARNGAEESLELLVNNAWWAARIANGVGESDGDQHVTVADHGVRLRLTEVGDGSLDPFWQRELLAHAVRDTGGLLVPGAEDRVYLQLHRDASGDDAVEAYLEELRQRWSSDSDVRQPMRGLGTLTRLVRRVAPPAG